MNANLRTVVFGLLFGASIVCMVLYGIQNRFGVNISLKWYLIGIVIGAGVSLFFGQQELPVDRKGVLSVFDNYTSCLAAPGLYWELPGVIGLKSVSAKQVPVKVTLKGPKLKGNVTLVSAEGLIEYVVNNVRVAATVENLDSSARGLCESSMRTFIASQTWNEIENARTDLREALKLIDENGKSKLQVLEEEAAEKGIKIVSLYLESAELPPLLVNAMNQQEIEEQERKAQDKERAQRQQIITEEMARGASYAEAQAEADRVTGKKTTVQTTQITGGGQGAGKKKGAVAPAIPVVQVNQGQGGGSP